MPDLSSMILNQSLVESSLASASCLLAKNVGTSIVDKTPAVDSSFGAANQQGVYAVKGDSLYKEEMDLNTDGVITNEEMSQYYAKLATDYGDGVSSLENKTVGNVVTTAQAANAYMANEAAYSAAYTSLIELSA